MRIKKFPITLFFNLAFIIFMVTKIGGNGADSLLKYALVLLFSIPYAIFYVKMAGGNITLTPEIIPLLGIFLVFENIYIPVLILLAAYITFDALRKIPFSISCAGCLLFPLPPLSVILSIRIIVIS